MLPRSPELMSRGDTALLVVDVQEKLIPHIEGHQRLVFNVGRLIDGARTLALPVLASEQYPRGLGPTVAALADRLGDIPDKLTFSCGGCAGLFAADGGAFDQLGDAVHKILVSGIETHVCVAQTVFDLMAAGYRVFVPVDAVASRHAIDHDTALRRMESSGATLTTTEAALFEWCALAGTDEFKQISRLVKGEEVTR